MEFSYAAEFVSEFDKYRHLLLDKDFKMFWRESEKNKSLLSLILEFRALVLAYRADSSEITLSKICKILDSIGQENSDLGAKFCQSIKECIDLLQGELDSKQIASMPTLTFCWGRGQQYISFIKRA